MGGCYICSENRPRQLSIQELLGLIDSDICRGYMCCVWGLGMERFLIFEKGSGGFWKRSSFQVEK